MLEGDRVSTQEANMLEAFLLLAIQAATMNLGWQIVTQRPWRVPALKVLIVV